MKNNNIIVDLFQMMKKEIAVMNNKKKDQSIYLYQCV